jgi:hypothetical protein
MAAKKSKPKKSKARKSAASKGKHRVASRARKPVRAKNKRGKSPKRGKATGVELVNFAPRGLGARSAGQSGDTQGLSASPAVDSESVEELLEEGQAFEAEVLNGVERAADPDESEVVTSEVAEDDVPEEYREKD